MLQNTFIYFNMADPVASGWTDDGNMYNTNAFLAMDSTAAGVVTMYFKAWNGHADAPDDIALTVDASGNDASDQTNRLAAMDAMASKLNTVNKEGFVVGYSEIENVKPGGITAIAVTLDAA